MKQKVDKKSDVEYLVRISKQIDIDKDSKISEIDLKTCLKNLPNTEFWRNDGHKRLELTERKAFEVISQIHDAIRRKKVPLKVLFDKMDVNNDNFVSLPEFHNGLNELLTLSRPVVEQLYNLMDKQKIKLINFK